MGYASLWLVNQWILSGIVQSLSKLNTSPHLLTHSQGVLRDYRGMSDV